MEVEGKLSCLPISFVFQATTRFPLASHELPPVFSHVPKSTNISSHLSFSSLFKSLQKCSETCRNHHLGSHDSCFFLSTSATAEINFKLRKLNQRRELFTLFLLVLFPLSVVTRNQSNLKTLNFEVSPTSKHSLFRHISVDPPPFASLFKMN
jgi:hypothetical protein